MKRLIVLLLALMLSLSTTSQTMIEVIHPETANLIFIQTDDSSCADVIVFKTDNKECAESWDLMWKFKKWGFSNFAVYIAPNELDPNLTNEETGKSYRVNATVYFTQNPAERRYRDPRFNIEGLMKIKKVLYLPYETK